MTTSRRCKILLVCGSLRPNSLNAQLLALAPQLAPPGMTFVVDDQLPLLPLYSEALDHDEPPAAVRAFRQALRDCDGLIVASPEYNHSLAGTLKNAIDWASRPYAHPPLSGKCALVWLATSGSGLGFAALGQTQAILQAMNNFVLVSPRVVVQRAQDKLRRDGAQVVLDDAVAQGLLRAQLAGLQDAVAAGVGASCRRGLDHLAAAQAARPAS